jgi:hypothetical protein
MINGLDLVGLERTSLCPIGSSWIRGKEEIQVLHSIKMFDRCEQNHGFVDKAETDENGYSFSTVRFRESLSAVDKNPCFGSFTRIVQPLLFKGKIARGRTRLKYCPN